MIKFDVIVIGGGPAGLFTALNIKNKKILLLEKNDRCGVKFLMSGGGKCNITHSGSIKKFIDKYNNGRFIRSSLYSFSNKDLIDYFNKKGIDFFVDKNGKFFPKEKNAKDLLKILIEDCLKNKVKVNKNEKVLDVEKNKDKFEILTEKNNYRAKKIIIATGGKSYSSTGSSGDGYDFAKKFGHTIIKPKPALVPAIIKNYKFSKIAGVSVRKSQVNIYRNNKKIFDYCGDILFTHEGLTGPGILNISRNIKKDDLIKFSLLDYENENIFRIKLKKIFEENKDKDLKNILSKVLQKSIVEIIMKNFKNTKGRDTSKNVFNKLINKILYHEVKVENLEGFNKAMVTTGGISLKEISNQTFESKKIKNLYFVGEVLDIDGETGGYNLQYCFSSAKKVSEIINNR